MKTVQTGRVFNHLFILYENEIPKILHETNEKYRQAEGRLEKLVKDMQKNSPDNSVNMFGEIMGEIRTLRDLDSQLAYAIGVQDGIKISHLRPEDIAAHLYDDLRH